SILYQPHAALRFRSERRSATRGSLEAVTCCEQEATSRKIEGRTRYPTKIHEESPAQNARRGIFAAPGFRTLPSSATSLPLPASSRIPFRMVGFDSPLVSTIRWIRPGRSVELRGPLATGAGLH